METVETMEQLNYYTYDRFELHKLNPDCIYCKGPIKVTGRHNVDWNIDHIFPKALFKWTSCPTELIEQKINVVLTHPSCNLSKGSRILTSKELNELYLFQGHYNALRKLHKELEPYIKEYMAIVNDVYRRQKRRCGRCGCNISKRNLVLRRYDHSKERIKSNAILLCPMCTWNWKYITFNSETMQFKG